MRSYSNTHRLPSIGLVGFTSSTGAYCFNSMYCFGVCPANFNSGAPRLLLISSPMSWSHVLNKALVSYTSNIHLKMMLVFIEASILGSVGFFSLAREGRCWDWTSKHSQQRWKLAFVILIEKRGAQSAIQSPQAPRAKNSYLHARLNSISSIPISSGSKYSRMV